MRRVCVCLFGLIVVSCLAYAQDSRADLFAGYSYVNIDTNGLSTRQSANGWETSIAGNFNNWFAAEADVTGFYKNYNVLGINVSVQDYSYVAGPRLNFKPLFVHALVGGDHLRGGALGLSASQDGLAGAFGGGVQWKVSGPFSLRASSDYVFTRHNIFGGSSVTQNDVRASVGIVYSFGGGGRTTRAARPIAARVAVAGMAIPSMGITVIAGHDQGAEITGEAANGPAARASLHPGDVINSVDDKPVKTPAELAGVLAARSPGDEIKLGVRISGYWQTEIVLLLENH